MSRKIESIKRFYRSKQSKKLITSLKKMFPYYLYSPFCEEDYRCWLTMIHCLAMHIYCHEATKFRCYYHFPKYTDDFAYPERGKLNRKRILTIRKTTLEQYIPFIKIKPISEN